MCWIYIRLKLKLLSFWDDAFNVSQIFGPHECFDFLLNFFPLSYLQLRSVKVLIENLHWTVMRKEIQRNPYLWLASTNRRNRGSECKILKWVFSCWENNLKPHFDHSNTHYCRSYLKTNIVLTFYWRLSEMHLKENVSLFLYFLQSVQLGCYIIYHSSYIRRHLFYFLCRN